MNVEGVYHKIIARDGLTIQDVLESLIFYVL